MTPVYLDFETYWSQTHTLSKMTNIAYVMHPDTEIISMSIRVKDYPTDVFFGEPAIKKALRSIDWSDKMAIGHNMSGFDALILRWRFGIEPAMWGCTAAMARERFAKTITPSGKMGVSLAKLVEEHLPGQKKDNTALVNTRGKFLADFTPEELDAMRIYNRDDTNQSADLFKVLAKGFPRKELWQVDATTRMLVEPAFELDTQMLKDALVQEKENKAKALLELYNMLEPEHERVARRLEGVDTEEYVRSILSSAAKFGEILKSRGVDVPMKVSPTNPDKMVPALAKTDEAFLKLQEHKDPVVACAARTRLEIKSTLLETRINAFLAAAEECQGRLPVPLKYAGADTTGRWSGEIYNPQNLPRIPRDKQGNIVPKLTNCLRMSMRAPAGHKVVVRDLSGIELRVNHFLWKVPSSMALFRADPAKADLYKDFAARLYDIAEEEVSKEQRQIGKIAHLGLGFGAGPSTFQRIAKMMGGVDVDEAEARKVTFTWRDEYAPIVTGWRTCHDALKNIRNGEVRPIDPWGLCSTGANHIALPSGRKIWYPDLRQDGDEWVYSHQRNKARIYAGKIDENIVQALARDVIAEMAYDVHKMTGFRPALMVHDELVYVVPESAAQGLDDALAARMSAPPSWWPELVTWSEGDIADSYGEAK